MGFFLWIGYERESDEHKETRGARFDCPGPRAHASGDSRVSTVDFCLTFIYYPLSWSAMPRQTSGPMVSQLQGVEHEKVFTI